jgi:hypothetical protein
MNSHFWLSILPILGPPSHQGPFTQRHQLQRHYQRLSEGRAVAACAEFAAGHAGTRGAAAPGRDAWDAPSYGHWKDEQLVTLVDSDGFGAKTPHLFFQRQIFFGAKWDMDDRPRYLDTFRYHIYWIHITG